MTQAFFNGLWLALFICITVVRKVHERKAGRHSSLKDTPIFEAALMVLWGAAAGVLPFVYIFTGWLTFADWPFTMPPLVSLLGGALFVVAIWLLHRSHADLGHLWSPTVTPEAKQPLVTDGVYRHMRHPMYTAHVLWGVAQTLLLPNWIAGALAPLFILALLVLRIPREERELMAEFGDVYQRYMDKTGALMPRFKRGDTLPKGDDAGA